MTSDRILIAEYAIKQLILLRDRTAMIIGTNDDVNAARAFIHGLGVGVAYFGCRAKLAHIRKAIVSRGWKWGPSAPVSEMRLRQMSNAEIVSELTEIEIACWELYCEDLRHGTG
jgi:hypothetical protein